MGMTETEMIGVIVLACLVTAVIVRLLVGFAQRETDLRDCGDSGLYLDTGIAQTMGNKEIQSDRVRAERTQAGALAVIADGIGKRNIGEVCAQIAMDTILDRYEPYTFLSEPDHFFRMSFYEANRRVQMTLERSKGGTSLGAVFVNGTKLYYALAGNIRIALFRGGRDHSAEQRAHAGCSGGGSVEGRKDFQTGSGVEHGRKKDVELRGNGWVSQN